MLHQRSTQMLPQGSSFKALSAAAGVAAITGQSCQELLVRQHPWQIVSLVSVNSTNLIILVSRSSSSCINKSGSISPSAVWQVALTGTLGASTCSVPLLVMLLLAQPWCWQKTRQQHCQQLHKLAAASAEGLHIGIGLLKITLSAAFNTMGRSTRLELNEVQACSKEAMPHSQAGSGPLSAAETCLVNLQMLSRLPALLSYTATE